MPTTPVGKIFKPTLRAMAAKEKVSELIGQLDLPARIDIDCQAEASGIVASLQIPPQLDMKARDTLKQALSPLPLHINWKEMA